MKNNETGEFELVLGNRQLLGVFFIGVFLFAVFFVMGYIVGRNSTPLAPMAGGTPVSASTRPTAASPAPANTSSPYEPPPEKPAAAEQTPAETQPAAKPAQTQAETTPSNAASGQGIPAAGEPAAGEMYLQVTSLKPQSAEAVAKTLKDKGLPTSLSPGVAGNVRVWVGPYTDRGKLGEAKAELERLGFGPFVVKPGK